MLNKNIKSQELLNGFKACSSIIEDAIDNDVILYKSFTTTLTSQGIINEGDIKKACHDHLIEQQQNFGYMKRVWDVYHGKILSKFKVYPVLMAGRKKCFAQRSFQIFNIQLAYAIRRLLLDIHEIEFKTLTSTVLYDVTIKKFENRSKNEKEEAQESHSKRLDNGGIHQDLTWWPEKAGYRYEINGKSYFCIEQEYDEVVKGLNKIKALYESIRPKLKHVKSHIFVGSKWTYERKLHDSAIKSGLWYLLHDDCRISRSLWRILWNFGASPSPGNPADS